jgi:predicted metal-binding membrane protein
MMWMRMPGQSWAGAGAAFLGMWSAMMAVMMLPSLIPMLRGYRSAVAASVGESLGVPTVWVGLAYFSVWTLCGAAVFALGALLTELQMLSPRVARAAPGAIGMVVLIMGVLQFTAWKAYHLACCRGAGACDRRAAGCGRVTPGAGAAWRYGISLGWHCCCCCAGLTAILACLGIMDLRVMAAATAAITAERLAPAGLRVARAIGVIAVAAGLLLIAGAVISG